MNPPVPVDIAAIADLMQEGMYVTDRSRQILRWNAAAERITGYTSDEVVGRCCADGILMHVDDTGRVLCHSSCPLAEAMRVRAPQSALVALHHKRGHRVTVKVRVTPVFDASGAVVGAAEVFSDESAIEGLRERITTLERLALVDTLTQLPNRRYLEAALAARFAELSRSGISFGAVFLDVDRFKSFNDSYGHETGDLALQTVANALAGSVRPGDLVGRWGGEEFLAIFPVASVPELLHLAERLRVMVRNSVVHAQAGDLGVTISVGADVARPADTSAELLKRIDGYMYASKRAGGDRVTSA